MDYLDNAATTRVCDEAAKAALACMTETFGNPSSLHRVGLAAEQKVSEARRKLAAALGCREPEVYFTSGATESNNIALLGAAQARRREGSRILTTQIEHASVAHTMDELERRGFDVVRVPARDGRYYAQDFIDAADDKTILVSCMAVNNETGLKLPFAEIAAGVKRKAPRALAHVDAVQAFCKLPFKVKNTEIDLLSASGHKLYAPKGVGLLMVRAGVHIPNHCFGGGQENGLRPGTEPVPLIAAFGASAAKTHASLADNLTHYAALNARLRRHLAELDGVAVNSREDGAPYILNLSAAGIRSEIFLHYLERRELYVSSGSACSKGAKTGVLPALGFSREREDSALRVSFAADTTEQQIDRLAQALADGLKEIAHGR